MSLEISLNKKKRLYEKHLSLIGDIKFTFRELDVISCVLHNRGEKKIASLLLISPRTVGTHLHNIMLKLGQSSREHVIDFIEKSGKLLYVKKYYLQILIQSSFEQSLIKIGKTINRKMIDCSINADQLNTDEKNKLNNISTHLKLANINLIKNGNNLDECEYNINFIKSNFIPKAEQGDIFLLLEKASNESDFSSIKYIDFCNDKDYYASIFGLLKQILGDKEILAVSDEFFGEFEAIKNSWEGAEIVEAVEVKEVVDSPPVENIRRYSNKLLIILILLVLCVIAYLAGKNNVIFRGGDQDLLRSELSLPQDGVLLDRTQTISRIANIFKKKSGIQAVALVGIGGSGKSTIAKKYAKESGSPIIWEINAESRVTLVSSMKQIAYAIALKENKRDELDRVLRIKEVSERERGLLLFLRKEAKSYPGWLIIYDNVKTFKDIEKFYPHDDAIWGEGNVLITTNDNNIAHNENILVENIIRVSGLTKREKLDLFTSILGKDDSKNIVDYEKCLKEIPPFPLDISIAAHYIRETNIKCAQYSKYSSSDNKSFRSAQRNILNDVGKYSKIRYDIITLPIQHMVEKSADFRDLLLMISTIASNNIPKKLLVSYKGDIVVDKFIYELKKFSLITKDLVKEGDLGKLFSIHSSTQEVIFAYFVNSLQFAENSKQLHDILTSLDNHLSKELDKHNMSKMQLLIPHIKALLSHAHLFSNEDVAMLNSKLGICYFYLGRYDRAKEVLQKSLTMYSKNGKKFDINQARVLARLGSVYRNIADFEKAKECLEKAMESYKLYYGLNHTETAWISTTLGSVYRNIGDYSRAKSLLKNGYYIYKQQYSEDHKSAVWSSSYLGQIYKNIGSYTKARRLLEKTLITYEKEYGVDHTKTAWSLVHLASVYRSIGYPDKAKDYLVRAIKIYKKERGEESFEYAWSLAHLSAVYRDLGNLEQSVGVLNISADFYNKNLESNHIIQGWIKFHLGSAYRHIGEWSRASKLLKESLKINEDHYGKNHIKTAKILNSLGKVGVANQSFEGSKEYLEKALDIYIMENHYDRYKVYEALGDLYRAMYKKGEGNSSLLKKSLGNFRRAMVVVEKHFPADSIHVKRIKSKIASFDNKY